MTSYQTVQVVAYSATPIANQDFVALAPGYTVSGGSISVGVGSSSATSITVTSAFSKQVGNSNITLDLPILATPGSYKSVTVDAYGRVTAASASLTTADIAGVWTSDVSAVNVYASVVSAGLYLGLPGLGSSGTSLTWTSALSGQVGGLLGSNVTLDLSAVGTPGSYCSVTVDSRGRVTAGATSITTAAVTGTWTSGVSSGDVQGLGSTWTVSRLSSAQSILANAVWASGFSGLGSIATISRISSDRTVYGVDIWGSALSLTGDARIKGVSYTWPSASAAGVLTDNGSGTLSWAAGGGGGAPTTSQYVTLALDGTLSAERVLAVDSSISMFDGGANGNVTLSAVSGLGGTSIRTLSADTGRVALAIAHVDGLGFPLAANTWYRWQGLLYYRTQATTTGLRVKLLASTAPSKWAGSWDINFAADGTGGVWCSSDTDASLSVESSTPTAVLATGQTFLARGEYLFLSAGAASNCSVAFGTEINNSRVTLEAGSACFLTRLS